MLAYALPHLSNARVADRYADKMEALVVDLRRAGVSISDFVGCQRSMRGAQQYGFHLSQLFTRNAARRYYQYVLRRGLKDEAALELMQLFHNRYPAQDAPPRPPESRTVATDAWAAVEAVYRMASQLKSGTPAATVAACFAVALHELGPGAQAAWTDREQLWQTDPLRFLRLKRRVYAACRRSSAAAACLLGSLTETTT